MSKTVIDLSDEQTARREEIAAKEGRSVSDVVRESVEAYLGSHVPIDRETLKRRFLEAAGSFEFGAPDVAVEHDKYFVEAIEET